MKTRIHETYLGGFRGGHLLPDRRPLPLAVFDMALMRGKNRPTIVSMGGRLLAASLLKEKAAEIVFLADTLDEWQKISSPSLPLNILQENRPIFFLLTLYDDFFIETRARTEAIKEKYPNARIIMGGPGVTLFNDLSKLALLLPEVEVFVKGDGDLVLPKILRALSRCPIDYLALRQMKGVLVKSDPFYYAENGVNTLTRDELEALPGIESEAGIAELYDEIVRTGYLSLNTSRSCRYRCVFCSHKYHPTPIYWSAERIIQELEKIHELIQKGILPKQAYNINFSDDDFFQDEKRVLAFTEMVAQRPHLLSNFIFDFQGSVGSFYRAGSPRVLKTELLSALAGINIRALFFGTDGFHDTTLARLGKSGYSFKDAVKLMDAVECLEDIVQWHYCILTYPEITRPVLLESIMHIKMLLERYPSLYVGPHFFITARESNRIGAAAMRCGLMPYVEGPDGALKWLPKELQINDARLNYDFFVALMGSMARDYIKSQHPTLVKEWSQIIDDEYECLGHYLPQTEQTIEGVLLAAEDAPLGSFPNLLILAWSLLGLRLSLE